MSRLAGRMMIAIVLQLIVTGGAKAGSLHEGDCAPAQIVTAPYKEQICYAGAHGYAACRWVKREYAVRVPAECVRPGEIEDAYKIRWRDRTGVAAKG
ncbi:hypothetical protein ACFSCV_07455 [Methylopila henanensis]|uniref:DUF3551 domain-containing protein n=1 Tax=Methylopila henanensis TaxID=873516 RepID=A0ABW4K8F5_9HYPH